jgi:hypothetical protein
VQIVTDNGSNYKKACKMISHKFLIVWQSCLAHTINLMLCDILPLKRMVSLNQDSLRGAITEVMIHNTSHTRIKHMK